MMFYLLKVAGFSLWKAETVSSYQVDNVINFYKILIRKGIFFF